MTTKTVELPSLPKGKEFEEFISAYFQSAGFYTDRNIIDRETEEILELDITITNYSILPKPRIVEVKSGDWGFSDIFKVKGWMVYSNISKGIFIVQKGRANFEFFRKKANDIKIKLISIPDLEKTEHYLKGVIKKKNIDKRDIEIWRYSYWLERECLKYLKTRKKSTKSVRRYSAMELYYFNISSGIFFTPNLIDRLEKLYANHFENERLSAKVANEISGELFDKPHTEIPNKLFKETFYECKFNSIQITSLFEYLSRLTILKNSVDYLMFREVGDKRAHIGEIKLLGISITKLNNLPLSVRSGIDQIQTHKYYKFYPVFWQWFIFVFGGFIINEIKEREFELLSIKTGIPTDEIPNALIALDILFPTNGGWFHTNSKSEITELKMFPSQFKGIGAYYRRIMYTTKPDDTVGEYEDIGIKNKYANWDIIKWNNLLVDILYDSK
jgi:hypothetical protein